jgi:hypothetical protein
MDNYSSVEVAPAESHAAGRRVRKPQNDKDKQKSKVKNEGPDLRFN